LKARAGGKNDGGAKGQKAMGKYPLTSKMAECTVDVGTQTQGSLLQNVKLEVILQGSDNNFARFSVKRIFHIAFS